jgi:hypothetical protein
MARKTIRIAVIIDNKVDEIIDHVPGREFTREYDRMVEVGGRPDIVVGSTWPFSAWEDYEKTLKATVTTNAPPILEKKGGK